jgi:hypothetical protein
MPRPKYFVLPTKTGFEIRSREEGRVGFSPERDQADKWLVTLNNEKEHANG